MKKLVLLIALATFAAMPAFAAGTSVSGQTIGGSVFTCSTNVTIYATSTVSVYAAASGHLNGDKAYTTDSSSASISAADKTKGEAISADLVPELPGASS